MATNLIGIVQLEKSLPDIEKDLVKLLFEKVKKDFMDIRKRNQLKKELEILVEKVIKNSEIYGELISQTDFHGEIGLINPVGVMNDVIDTIKQNIYIEVFPKQIANRIIIDVEIGILLVTHYDIVNIKPASFVSERGYVVEWLKFLLMRGESAVVYGYRFKSASEFITKSGKISKGLLRSRTGLGLMVPTINHHYRVSKFARGTIGDNFLTRAIDTITEDQINELYTRIYLT